MRVIKISPEQVREMDRNITNLAAVYLSVVFVRVPHKNSESGTEENNVLRRNLSYWHGWGLLYKRSSHRWRMRPTTCDIWINIRTTNLDVVLLFPHYWFESLIYCNNNSGNCTRVMLNVNNMSRPQPKHLRWSIIWRHWIRNYLNISINQSSMRIGLMARWLLLLVISIDFPEKQSSTKACTLTLKECIDFLGKWPYSIHFD